ncbi:MAG: ribbon-helix-helix domain-containing protein [Ignisphaera sp.]
MKYKNAEIELDIVATKVISVKIDIETLNEMEDLCRKHHYRSRSDFIRDAIRLYINILKQVNDKSKLEELLKHSKNCMA